MEDDGLYVQAIFLMMANRPAVVAAAALDSLTMVVMGRTLAVSLECSCNPIRIRI